MKVNRVERTWGITKTGKERKNAVPPTTFEVCPYCDQQVEIKSTGVSKCPNCGKWISPCSMCNMDKVDCDNCITNKIAKGRNGEIENDK